MVPKLSTLDDLKRLILNSIAKNAYRHFGARQRISKKKDPHYQLQKCRSMSTVSANIRCIGYSRGFLWQGRQTTVELSTTVIFSFFGGYFFRNFRDKANVIVRRCAIDCWPVIENYLDLKTNNLEWPSCQTTLSQKRTNFEKSVWRDKWEHAGTTYGPVHQPWEPECTASQTDRQTDGRTDDRIMQIADHTV